MRRREIFAQAEDIAHYASLREAWATVLLDRKGKTPIRVSALEKYRGKHHEYYRDTIERYPTEPCHAYPRFHHTGWKRVISVKLAVFTLERTKTPRGIN